MGSQQKYFIDACVAMKALRNFCNVLFKTENETEIKEDNEKKEIGVIIKEEQQTNGSVKSSFFNISPTNTFSSFINKNKNNQNGKEQISENDDDDGSGNNLDSSSSSKGNGSSLQIPKQIAPKPNHLKIINDMEQTKSDND